MARHESTLLSIGFFTHAGHHANIHEINVTAVLA
jgi:hypothetical protein